MLLIKLSAFTSGRETIGRVSDVGNSTGLQHRPCIVRTSWDAVRKIRDLMKKMPIVYVMAAIGILHPTLQNIMLGKLRKKVKRLWIS